MPYNMPVLPDWIFYVFIVFAVMSFIVYIICEINEYREYKREKFRKQFKHDVAEAKKSNTLAEYYTAVAYGDDKDFSYWYDTAEKFK